MADSGDPGAFCAAISRRLVGALVLYCGDRWVAEELAQEALARTFEHWPRVAGMASPEGWTFSTAFNLARSWARRRAAERRAMSRLAASPADRGLPDAAVALAVREAVTALPPRQRAVVIARFYLGLGVVETATVLGCAPGTVKAHTHQAIASLRAMGLADLDEEELDATSR